MVIKSCDPECDSTKHTPCLTLSHWCELEPVYITIPGIEASVIPQIICDAIPNSGDEVIGTAITICINQQHHRPPCVYLSTEPVPVQATIP